MLSPRRTVEQLRVECNDRAAQEVISDAIDRVPGFTTPAQIPAADRRLPVGIASLAIGDREFSRKLLTHLQGADYLLLVARYFLWSGDDGLLRAQLPRIDAALQQGPPFVELHELAIALESIGADAEAAAVRSRCANVQRRILPDWDAANCNELPAAAATDTVNVFMYTMLGVAPDAPRGRIRIRLCLPEWLASLSVENLRMGDALLRLQCTRAGEHDRYVVEQIAGAMPVRLIFEPTFTRPIKSVSIDNAAAELSMQPHRDRVVTPVQLMLDHQRVLHFTT